MPYPLTGTPGEIYVDVVSGQTYQYDAALGMWVKAASAPTGALFHDFLPISANGQTLFTLTSVPTDALSVSANVNGVDYFQPDIVIAGNIITWAGPMTLQTTDRMVFTYV